VLAVSKDRTPVAFIDLPVFGRPAALVWHKRRWSCEDPACENRTWTEEDPGIAFPRLAMTSRAGRWVTERVAATAVR
jgi:hypothetical protein